MGRLAIPIQILITVLFRKVGIFVATIGAIVLWRAVKPTMIGVIAGSVLGLIGSLAFALGFFDRQVEVLISLTSNLRQFGLDSLASYTFADLVRATGSQDLSGYFRIIHWSEILDIYKSGGALVWLFGYGAGQTASLTTLGLVAHNDYLKVLVEFGLISLCIFTITLATIVINIKHQDARTIFTVLIIYFLSENLLNNFASMSLFFGFAGMLTKERVAPLSSLGILAPTSPPACPSKGN
jgi:hypothetical protein